MYLNPDVCEGAGVASVEDVAAYLSSVAPATAALLRARAVMPAIPPGFSPERYAASAGLGLDVSTMDAAIRAQAPRVGVPVAPPLPDCADTIPQDIVPVPGTPGVFRYPLAMTPRNLQAGDSVRALVGAASEQRRLVVEGIDYAARTVRLRGLSGESAVRLSGVYVSDLPRVALANLARGVADRSAASGFNADMYRLLYPDARMLGDDQAYVDWRASRSRVGSVRDLSARTDAPLPHSVFDSITVLGDARVGGALSVGQ